MYKIRLSTTLALFTILTPTAFSQEVYFRLKPAEQMLSTKSSGEKAEKIYVDIRANPGSWRENETIHFPVNLSPNVNASISATGLPGTIAYNEGLLAFTGNTSAGNPPYRNTFRIHASSIGFSESKEFDLYVYPELQVSTENYYLGRVGREFSASVSSSGLVGTPTWNVSSEIPGLRISEGRIAGIPIQEGIYSGLIVNVRDSVDNTSAQTTPFTIEIEPSNYTKTLPAGVNINIASYFSNEEWQSDIPKVAVIPQGTVIGSNNPSIPALYSGTNWGGELILRVDGEIQGAGGAANSGTGGTAILAQDSRLIVQNNGAIRAGGGGGGLGGTGSSYSYTKTEGPFFQQGVYEYSRTGFGWYEVKWNGNGTGTGRTNNSAFTSGIYTYYQGASTYNYSRYSNYAGRNASISGANIYRTFTDTAVGGTGGNGGIGRGYNQSLSSGSIAVTPAAGAGRGGLGGSGGDWGMSGSSGERGQALTANGVTDGTAGGLAGFAIAGSTTVSGNGEIQGR